MLQRAFAAAVITAACVAIPAAAQAATPLSPQRAHGRPPHQPARPRPALVRRSAGRSAATAADRAQSAYQVVVTKGDATVWDSGEVRSPASANVPYGGPALESATQYRWKVRVWDETGRPSDYSAPAQLRDRAPHQRGLDREVDRRARG